MAENTFNTLRKLVAEVQCRNAMVRGDEKSLRRSIKKPAGQARDGSGSSAPPAQPSSSADQESVGERCADKIAKLAMTFSVHWRSEVAKIITNEILSIDIRNWMLNGGGGFEYPDGLGAGKFTGYGVLSMIEAFRDALIDQELAERSTPRLLAAELKHVCDALRSSGYQLRPSTLEALTLSEEIFKGGSAPTTDTGLIDLLRQYVEVLGEADKMSAPFLHVHDWNYPEELLDRAKKLREEIDTYPRSLSNAPTAWIKTSERPPTEKDCDIHDLVLSWRHDEGNPDVYEWKDVAKFHKQFIYWMPIPALPAVEARHAE